MFDDTKKFFCSICKNPIYSELPAITKSICPTCCQPWREIKDKKNTILNKKRICPSCFKHKKTFYRWLYKIKKDLYIKDKNEVFSNPHKSFKYNYDYIVHNISFYHLKNTKIGIFFNNL